MRIFTVWEEAPDDNEMPWLVTAVDEYAVELCGGYPDEYKRALKENGSARRRELIIEISEPVVRQLFRSPVIRGKVDND